MRSSTGPRSGFPLPGQVRQAARGRAARPAAGRVVRRCRDLPGRELFQYVDADGEPRDVASDDVNDYLGAIAPGFTAKDFRTWAGTVLAYRALRALGKARRIGRSSGTSRRRSGGGRQPRQHPRGRSPGLHPSGGGRRLSRRTDPVGARPGGRGRRRGPGRDHPDEERAVAALLRARLREDADR